MFLDASALQELMSRTNETKAVSEWIAAGSSEPRPPVHGLFSRPSGLRPDDVPEWAPWISGSFVLVTEGRLRWVTQWLHPTSSASFSDAISAAMEGVGLRAARPPMPLGMLPVEFTSGSPAGTKGKEGRLVVAMHGVDQNGVGNVAFVLVRP